MLIFASGSWDSSIKIWNLENFKLIKVLQDHSRGVSCVRFSKNGKILVSCSYDFSIKLFDTQKFELKKTINWPNN